MDGRILALGIALIVTAIGLSTAIVMLPPVDTPSDYSLLDEVAGGEVRPGLYYTYTRSSDQYSRQLEITVMEVKFDGVLTKNADNQRFNGGMWTFGTDDFREMFFDYTDSANLPDGVTVSMEPGDVEGSTRYVLNGSGTVEDSGFGWNKHMECSFENLEIVEDDETSACYSMDGKLSFGGTESSTFSIYVTEYKDMVMAYSTEYAPGACKVTGSIVSEGTYVYLDAAALAEAFVKSDPNYIVVEKSEEVMYASIPCDRYTLKGSDGINSYDGYVIYLHNNYVIKGDGTVDGESITERMDIYYKDE